MPSPSVIVTPSFGQTCAEVVSRAKRAAVTEGRTYRKSDLAAAIDILLPSWLEQHKLKITAAPTKAGSDVPPSPEAVAAYSASIGYPVDGRAWCDFYEQKGWMIGNKAKMKNWQAAVRTWKTNRWGQGGIALAQPATTATGKARDYSKI